MNKKHWYSIAWIIILTTTIPFAMLRIVENWRNNKGMVCLLPDALTPGQSLSIEICFSGTISHLPRIVAPLLAERNLQLGIAIAPNQNACQDILADAYYDKRLSYTQFVSQALETEFKETISCPEKLPSSQYIFTQAQIYWEAEQWGLYEIATTLAYEHDKTWQRPLWRAVNAQQMGEINASKFDWEGAIQAFQRAIESYQKEPALDPVYQARVYGLMASVANQSGQDVQALAYYENSFQLYPQVPSSLIQEYVAVLWRSSALNNIALVDRVLALAANKKTDHKFLYQFATALIDASSSNVEVSKGIVSNLETILPRGYFEVIQGVIARQEGNFPIAQQLFESALASGEIEDVNLQAEIWSRLAIVYFLDDRFAGSIEAQEKAVSLRPDSSSAWYQLALFYEKVGQMANARSAIAEALSLQPDNEAYLRFLEQLDFFDE